MKLLNKATLLTTVMASGLAFSSMSYAGKIYMWYTTDDKGKQVPKYGETPPKGVNATLISETNEPAASSSSSAKSEQNENLTDEQKQMRAQRDKECDAEESRLSTLQNSGSRIRMSTPDGGSRYLTPDEILSEIELSKTFLKDACGR